MRVKCKKCGAECCTCTGCKPSTYVNGLCPNCQKITNANSTNNRMSGLQQFERTIKVGGLQSAEFLKEQIE